MRVNFVGGHPADAVLIFAMANHSVRRLEDFDTEDEEEITSSQTGMHSERTLLPLQEVRDIFDVCWQLSESVINWEAYT